MKTVRVIMAVVWLCISAAVARAQPADPLREVDLEQKLGALVPLDAPFVDDAGRAVTLGDYFGHQKPVILVLAYYECPMLCTLVLTNLAEGLREVSFEPGKEFEVVVISINPHETPVLAARKKKNYLNLYGKRGGANGWHLLTGRERDIRAVADAVGFRYVYDEASKQYAHPAGIIVLGPEGVVSRYLYGSAYRPRDLKLGLTEAGHGDIGSPTDKVLLRCFQYDPMTGKYGFAIMAALRIGGVVTTAALLVLLWALQRRAKKREAAWAAGEAQA